MYNYIFNALKCLSVWHEDKIYQNDFKTFSYDFELIKKEFFLDRDESTIKKEENVEKLIQKLDQAHPRTLEYLHLASEGFSGRGFQNNLIKIERSLRQERRNRNSLALSIVAIVISLAAIVI
ncbi:MAG: hypothetical protein IPP74_12635 [Alphaproteobacteria bacterium]|nr:hypothetical protein [Alphaproteobacteria bacterium]